MTPLTVIPAPVPWAVDASTPFVRVQASDEGPTKVRLLVDFSASPEGPADAEVELTFTGPGGWLRAMPGEHEHRFGLDALPLRPALEQAPGWYAAQAAAHVAEHGTHPCPFFFVVSDSPWIRRLGLESLGLQHYVLFGDGMLWEFLARDFEWTIAAS